MHKMLVGFVALMGSAIWTVPQPKADSSPDVPAVVPECELADQWVAANLDALPTTLATFGEHSTTFRRAIYKALDTDVRISLWKEHLVAVARDVESPQQRLFLSEVSRDLDHYLQSATPQSEIKALEEKAVAVLGKDLAHRAIAVLGPDPEPTTRGGILAPDCGCSTESDWCNAWRWPWQPVRSCVEGSAGCLETEGCGTLLLFPCDGLCERWLFLE